MSLAVKKKKNLQLGSFFTGPVIISSLILLIVFICALFSGAVAPYDPEAVDLTASLIKPFTAGHILGTDQLGRDLFSRLVCGANTSITNALLIVVFEIIVGVPIGLIGGYYANVFDTVTMRIWDIVCSLPTMLLAFVLIAAFGRGAYSGVMAMGIVYTPLTAKLARSLILTEKSKVYVEAAKSLGYSDARIIFRHILPNCISTMVAQFTLDIGSAIGAMAGLSYLGLGVQPPQSDWGTLLKDGMTMIYRNPVLLIAPALVIMITAISINIFSDGIQSYIDPGQRKLMPFNKFRKKLLTKPGKASAGKPGGTEEAA